MTKKPPHTSPADIAAHIGADRPFVFKDSTERAPPETAPEASEIAASLTDVSFSINRVSVALHHQNARKWTTEQTNSAIIGHLLVLWPMVLSAVAFFAMPREFRLMAVLAIASGATALLLAWGVGTQIKGEPMGSARIGAIVLTILSWVLTAAWAFRAAV